MKFAEGSGILILVGRPKHYCILSPYCMAMLSLLVLHKGFWAPCPCLELGRSLFDLSAEQSVSGRHDHARASIKPDLIEACDIDVP